MRLAFLTFRTNRYGRESQSVINVTDSYWNKSITKWIWPAIMAFEKETALTPPNRTVWDSLVHAIPGLAEVRSWKEFTSVPIKNLEVDHVRNLFIDIDDTFHNIWGADRGAVRSSVIRNFLLKYLLSQCPDGTLARVKGSFSPKGRKNFKPRKLISDQIVVGKEGVEPPIGALPHSNPMHLKELTRIRLRDDLQNIVNACTLELDVYVQACALLDKYQHAPINHLNEQVALMKINKAEYGCINGVVSELEFDELQSLFAYYIRNDSLIDAKFLRPVYKGAIELGAELSRQMKIPPLLLGRCIRYRYYPHQTVLVAAILLIQIATAWNVSSVMNLSAANIKELGKDQYLIQSTKTRTGDDTPQSLLEGGDNPAVRAIKLVLDRLAAIKARGWAHENMMNLWLSPHSNYDSSRGQSISGLSAGLHKLRKKYSLPLFTYEQIRVQKLTIVSIESGPIAAAEVAGHSTFGTIGGYIDHLLTRRLNSSVNLEFQRRWEKEVTARVEFEQIQHPLVPVGDGSSCIGPENPPNYNWLDAGVCNAKNCHVDSGCPNRVLVINKKRVEEVLLTRKYYDANWLRLYSNNQEDFISNHLSKLEFNMYLYEYIIKGPYRGLINDQT